MLSVVKRDGAVVDFDFGKITEAVGKAMTAVKYSDNSLPFKVASNVEQVISSYDEDVSVEEIQELVVCALEHLEVSRQGKKRVSTAYKEHRHNRNKKRNSKARKVFYDIIGTKVTDVTRDNANMNADTPAGMMMKFASETTKPFTDDDLLTEEAREAHVSGKIHIHDEDYYPTKSLTCVQHPMNNITTQGFRAGHGASRPAKRIETGSIQCCISLETAQNEMHGGQAIPAFDFYLAPYVKKTFDEELKDIASVSGYNYYTLDEIIRKHPIQEYLYKELDGDGFYGKLMGEKRVIQHAMNKTVRRVHQAMEAFIHNMNTIHSRGGNQVVFSSINYGTDTSPEGRCIIRETLNSTWDGVGNGETAIFPIQIWKKKRGVNYLPEDPNYDLYKLACKVSARRFFPNFLNLDATFNQSPLWKAEDPLRYLHEVATMGCRTRVFEDLFGLSTSVGRGNTSFTSMNLPRLGIEVMEIEDKKLKLKKFFKNLGELEDLVARQLVARFNFQGTAIAKQFPLLMTSLWMGGSELKPTDQIREVIKHGTLGIGFIGLAECLIALTGHHHGESEEAQKLGLEIVTFMRDRAEGYKEKYGLNFSILATPAEGLAGRFTKIDKKKFGIIEGITDKEYYTNSNHVPVYFKCSAKHKAEVEAPYHDLTRGGHIFYVELDGDATHNPESVMAVVDLMDKNNMGYGSANHVRNYCTSCGKEWSERHATKCPFCGSEDIDTKERITGYLVASEDRWGSAKKAEKQDRVAHAI